MAAPNHVWTNTDFIGQGASASVYYTRYPFLLTSVVPNRDSLSNLKLAHSLSRLVRCCLVHLFVVDMTANIRF